MDYVYLLSGFVLLIVGGNLLVQGAVGLARRLGISPLLVGLVIVGFGTSTPELVASLTAALRGVPDIAIGSVVGSNIANVFLIVGIGALISPILCDPRSLRRDGAMLVGSAIALTAVVLAGEPLGLWIGIAFLAVLAAYIVNSYMSERDTARRRAKLGKDTAELVSAATGGEEPPRPPAQPLPQLCVALLGGLAGVIFGADLLVEGAVTLASSFGISDAVIGLTVVAVGTSLPELVTAIVAARRGHGDVALGNVVGSNIFNILGILGTTAVVTPVPIPQEIARLDLWVMLGATVLLLLFAATGHRIRRWEGVALLACYAAYYVVIFGWPAG